MHLSKFLDFSDVYDSSKWRFLYFCRGRFRKIKITWVMLDLLSWNSSQIDYQRFRVEWCLNFDFLKSWFFDVLKLLIVIFLQSDIGSKYFFQKSKIPLNLCKNTKFHIIRSTRSVWNRRQQNMKYMWSHGIIIKIKCLNPNFEHLPPFSTFNVDAEIVIFSFTEVLSSDFSSTKHSCSKLFSEWSCFNTWLSCFKILWLNKPLSFCCIPTIGCKLVLFTDTRNGSVMVRSI